MTEQPAATERDFARARWLLVGVFAVVSVLWCALYWRHIATFVHADATGYYKSAWMLAETGVFSESLAPHLFPISFRTPGYPAYLSLFFRFTGPSPFVAAVANLPWLLAAALGAFGLARCWGAGPRGSFAAGALTALHPLALFWAVNVYTDTMFAGLIVPALWMLLRSRDSASAWRWWMGAAVLLGVAALVRPVGLYVLWVFGAWVLWHGWRSRTQRGVVLLGVAAVLLAWTPAWGWMTRNRSVFGDFYFCEIGAWNLRHSHVPLILAEATGEDFSALSTRSFKETYRLLYMPESSPGPLQEQWTGEALEILAAHPWTSLRVTLAGLVPLCGGGVGDYGRPFGLGYQGVVPAIVGTRFGAPIPFGEVTPRRVMGVLLGLAEMTLLLWLLYRAALAVRERRRDAGVWLALAVVALLGGLSLLAGLNVAPRLRLPVWPVLVALAMAPRRIGLCLTNASGLRPAASVALGRTASLNDDTTSPRSAASRLARSHSHAAFAAVCQTQPSLPAS